jgi:hypothetical protein
MGKFKLPGKLPGSPNRVVMPAIQGGGSYRNPAMVIDRSAEILGAGIRSGMDKIGDALKNKAMDKISEEKGQEPQSNVDKEIKKTLDGDTGQNKYDRFMSGGYQAGDMLSSVVVPRTSFGFPMVDDELAAVGAPVDLPETPLEMKNDSPNKFLGGITAGVAGGSGASRGGQVDLQSLAGGGGMLARLAQAQLAQNAGPTQAQQAAAASTAAGGTIGTAAQNPMTGVASGGQTLNCTPVAMSYDPPLQANEKGGKKSVFNMNTKGMAETAFGTPAERQASVGAAFQMSEAQEKAFGPGGHSENPGLYKQLK